MTVVLFTKRPVRALEVSGSAADGYAARYIGRRPWDGPMRSDVASLALVADAVLDPRNRRGLPIIAPAELIIWAMSGATKLRPPPQRRQSDREKYEAVLAAQKLHDSRRWVPCHNPGGNAA